MTLIDAFFQVTSFLGLVFLGPIAVFLYGGILFSAAIGLTLFTWSSDGLNDGTTPWYGFAFSQATSIVLGLFAMALVVWATSNNPLGWYA